MVPFKRFSWAFKKPRRKKYKLLFHKGSFQKKVLKYGTPKPSIPGLVEKLKQKPLKRREQVMTVKGYG